MDLQSMINMRDALQRETAKTVEAMNAEVLSHATDFTSYRDLYLAVRAICADNEEFNRAMFRCRMIFLDNLLTKPKQHGILSI